MAMIQCKFNDLRAIKTVIKSVLLQQQLVNNIDESLLYTINEDKWKDHFVNAGEEAVEDNIKYMRESLGNIVKSGDGLVISHYNKGFLVPVEYDALFVIFSSSSEAFRQKHYRLLLELIFRCLTEKYPADKVSFENRVKVLIPIVKCDVIDHPTTENSEILKNLNMFLRYPRINQEDIYEIVTNKLGSDQFDLTSYQLTPLVIKNGHLGDYYTITIDVTVEAQPETLDFFAKFVTGRTENVKKLVENGPSKKEEFFYVQYLSALREYGLEKLQNFAARCYFSRQNDLLVLDNLANKGFKGYPPHTSLGVDAVTIGLKRIAGFHASSLILEDILSKKNGTAITLNQIYGEYFEEILFTNCAEGLTKTLIKLALETMLYILEKFPETYGSFTLDQLKEKINVGWNLSFQKVKESKVYTNVICHGDMHVSNILVKSTDGKCEDIKLVDFQLLRYCPLSQDLVLFIVQNTNKATRDQYFSTFLDQYYKELTQNLTDYDLDPEKVIPRNNFLDSVNYMKSQGVFHALYYSPILLLGPEIRTEIFFKDQKLYKYYLYENRRALIDLAIQDVAYRSRLKGLVEDFVELCEKGDI
ncbi:hypothetical protein GWI33_017855 [Rhynchophorus ferrugineus]|uniref:CHK kinase-like domain-containing protein n=1 Tax=Rhynchophorus ferrugineus TaxID=354439 RepID=A0A834HYZ1_RHYFE|nr:hypothetical protein GWI33_017855 [Rhynchophorus ferrugineus]